MMMCVPSISKQSPFSSSCSSAPKRKKKRARQHQMAGEACSPTPKGRRSVLANANAQEKRARQRQSAGTSCSPAPEGRSNVLVIAKWQEHRPRQCQRAGTWCSLTPTGRSNVLDNAKRQEKRPRKRQRARKECSPAPAEGRKTVLANASGQENRARHRPKSARTSSSPAPQEGTPCSRMVLADLEGSWGGLGRVLGEAWKDLGRSSSRLGERFGVVLGHSEVSWRASQPRRSHSRTSFSRFLKTLFFLWKNNDFEGNPRLTRLGRSPPENSQNHTNWASKLTPTRQKSILDEFQSLIVNGIEF